MSKYGCSYPLKILIAFETVLRYTLTTGLTGDNYDNN